MLATHGCSSQSMVGHVVEGLPPARDEARIQWPHPPNSWYWEGRDSCRIMVHQAKYGASTFNCKSIAEITEADFIKRLLSDFLWRSRVFNISGMPAEPSAFVSVDLRGTPGNFLGDVDVLLCPRSQPELATAISVKRIKFGANAIRKGQPNKAGGRVLIRKNAFGCRNPTVFRVRSLTLKRRRGAFFSSLSHRVLTWKPGTDEVFSARKWRVAIE